NFFVNSAVLHDEQISEAEEIYNLMKPSLNKGEVVLIRIVGSASIEGSEEYNLLLSNRRTETMREYLVREGVDPDLIITSYKGNSEAIARDIFEENDDAEPNPEDRYVKVYMMITQ
ncbi:MAG: OmpA family protein, partial [Chitinophagales bacterium]